ncbi:MFS transporter [Geomonas sp. RF6]|uniref:MFS transporter n=1 Tax=Geomonas sp. RF6 TaxID=2897342 RepID=UPI001E64FBC3|nr:MFS transporter [Geomonas sp. RF6]UFS72159.1 MFS transporter [Geomonas sp. RF6]
MPEKARMRRKRTTIFCALAYIYILVYFYRVSMAVVAGDLARELHLTPQQLGTLASVLFYVYGLAQIPLGPMIDRLGGRIVITGCGVLTTCGGFLFAQATNMAMAMAGRVLIGVGTSCVLMATFTIFSYWFSKDEFGRVSSLTISIGNMGNLAATAPLALAVAALGWRKSFVIIAFLQAVATVLVFLMVQDRPGQAGAVQEGARREGILEAWGYIGRNRDFWLLAFLAFFWYGNYLTLQGLWGGPYLLGVLKLTQVETGRMLMYTSIGFICGSFFLDRVSRRLFRSYKRTLWTGQFLLLLLVASFLGPAEWMHRALLGPLFFAIGIAVSTGASIYPIMRSMFPVRLIGTALTSLNFFVLMGAALTQQIMGLIIGRFSSNPLAASPHAFHTAFLFPTAGLAAALVCYLFAREYKGQD